MNVAVQQQGRGRRNRSWRLDDSLLSRQTARPTFRSASTKRNPACAGPACSGPGCSPLQVASSISMRGVDPPSATAKRSPPSARRDFRSGERLASPSPSPVSPSPPWLLASAASDLPRLGGILPHSSLTSAPAPAVRGLEIFRVWVTPSRNVTRKVHGVATSMFPGRHDELRQVLRQAGHFNFVLSLVTATSAFLRGRGAMLRRQRPFDGSLVAFNRWKSGA